MEIFEWTEETPVTANNLNEMQNIINGNILDIYSTSEIKTNKVGVNDKPIYRVCIEIYNVNGATSYIIDNLSSYCPNYDYENIMLVDGRYKRNNYDQWWNIQEYLFNKHNGVDKLELRNLGSGGASSIKVTLEYTKTTN